MLSKALIKNKLRKTFLVNHKKTLKNINLTVFEKNPSYLRMSRNRRDTSEPNDNLKCQVFKVEFKGQSHMSGLNIFLTQI